MEKLHSVALLSARQPRTPVILASPWKDQTLESVWKVGGMVQSLAVQVSFAIYARQSGDMFVRETKCVVVNLEFSFPVQGLHHWLGH